MTYVKIAVPYSKIEGALVERLKAAEVELAKVRDEVRKYYLGTPEGLGILAMDAKEYSRSSVSVDWPNVFSGVPTYGFTVTVSVSENYDAKRAASNPALNVGEKTLNALLTGKLLTDDQKKALLKRIGVDLEDLSEKSAA